MDIKNEKFVWFGKLKSMFKSINDPNDPNYINHPQIPLGNGTIGFINIENDLIKDKKYVFYSRRSCSIYFSKTNDNPSEDDIIFIKTIVGDSSYQFIAPDVSVYKYIMVENKSGSNLNWRIYDILYKEADGALENVKRNGLTTERPLARDIFVGFCYFDTDLNKPIYAKTINIDTDVVEWVDALGTQC